MAARVMLLLVAVCAFVAIWSGDGDRHRETDGRSHEFAKVAKAAATKPAIAASKTAISSRRQSPSTPRRPLAMVASHERRRVSCVHRPEFMVATAHPTVADVPLPGGITPGEYRIVCSDGQVQRLRLTAEELRRRGLLPNSLPRDFYRLHDGRVRWYFIRVDTVESKIAGRSPAAPSIRPAVTGKPRSTWHAFQAWISGTKPLTTSLLHPLQTGWSAGRLAAARAAIEMSRRWHTAVDAAFVQFRQAAVRARRIAAESGATQR